MWIKKTPPAFSPAGMTHSKRIEADHGPPSNPYGLLRSAANPGSVGYGRSEANYRFRPVRFRDQQIRFIDAFKMRRPAVHIYFKGGPSPAVASRQLTNATPIAHTAMPSSARGTNCSSNSSHAISAVKGGVR
jgi:hypothetical protein